MEEPRYRVDEGEALLCGEMSEAQLQALGQLYQEMVMAAGGRRRMGVRRGEQEAEMQEWAGDVMTETSPGELLAAGKGRIFQMNIDGGISTADAQIWWKAMLERGCTMACFQVRLEE